MFSRQLLRRFTTTAIRRSEDEFHGGIPGGNLPFDINNRFKLTGVFILFFGSGIAIPYLIVRHQLVNK